jgi:hypothetical protein
MILSAAAGHQAFLPSQVYVVIAVATFTTLMAVFFTWMHWYLYRRPVRLHQFYEWEDRPGRCLTCGRRERSWKHKGYSQVMRP